MSARAKRDRNAMRTAARIFRERGMKIRGWKPGRAFQIVWWWRAWRLRVVGAWPAAGSPIYRWTVRVGPLEVRRWA